MDGNYSWFIPIFWILFLLVKLYRAENKKRWLKTHWGIAAMVTVFMSPMLLVQIVSTLVD